jgi:nucleoside-diphosphate-sugar epimerase
MSNAVPNEPTVFPDRITTEEELDDFLTRPRGPLLEAIRHVQSPLVVLGASGKMGPSLCVLARRAAEAARHPLRVVAVSRFSDRRSRDWLENGGVETVACDLLDRRALEGLSETPNLIYLVGLKFGTQQNPALTWAVNTLGPAHVAERYPAARMAVLSTGNVYPFVSSSSGGATEDYIPAPLGEYAGAALARERIFEYYSQRQGTRLVLLRLNYAVELRYGVLIDIGSKVWAGEAIDLGAGHLNCLWQGDANEMILRALALATNPPALFNLTGPEVLSVRELAQQFGQWMNREPKLVGTEAPTALLSNSARLCARLGAPVTPLARVVRWTADWIQRGGPTLGKPTHFEVRTGQY